MQPTKDNSQMQWVNYCAAQNKQIARLEKMLSRCCFFIELSFLDRGGYKFPPDIEEWWDHYKNLEVCERSSTFLENEKK